MSMEKLVTSRHEIFACSFNARVQKDPGEKKLHRCKKIQGKKARAQSLLHGMFQVSPNAVQWPASRGISSVNYILSSNATFSETNMGYQPIVLSWPQTRFSYANPGLEGMQQDGFFAVVQPGAWYFVQEKHFLFLQVPGNRQYRNVYHIGRYRDDAQHWM